MDKLVSSSNQSEPPESNQGNAGKRAGRNYSGLSQEQRKSIRRQQFLEAGTELFGTIGFRATTVRAVCKQAKLTDRYFYESFGSLEALAMASYEDCMTGLIKTVLDSVTEVYESQGSFAAVEAGLDTYFSVLEESRIARICMIELEGISPEVDRLYNNYIRNIAKIFIALTNKAFPEWTLSAGELEVVAISLIGVLRQTATTWLNDNYDKERQTLVSGTLNVFLGTIKQIANS